MSEEPKPTPVVSINHVGVHASDPEHSVQWYQGIFGFPVVARQGDTKILRVGQGPQYMAIHGKPDKHPGYTHFGFSIDSFNATQEPPPSEGMFRARGPSAQRSACVQHQVGQ